MKLFLLHVVFVLCDRVQCGGKICDNLSIYEIIFNIMRSSMCGLKIFRVNKKLMLKMYLERFYLIKKSFIYGAYEVKKISYTNKDKISSDRHFGLNTFTIFLHPKYRTTRRKLIVYLDFNNKNLNLEWLNFQSSACKSMFSIFANHIQRKLNLG